MDGTLQTLLEAEDEREDEQRDGGDGEISSDDEMSDDELSPASSRPPILRARSSASGDRASIAAFRASLKASGAIVRPIAISIETPSDSLLSPTAANPPPTHRTRKHSSSSTSSSSSSSCYDDASSDSDSDSDSSGPRTPPRPPLLALNDCPSSPSSSDDEESDDSDFALSLRGSFKGDARCRRAGRAFQDAMERRLGALTL